MMLKHYLPIFLCLFLSTSAWSQDNWASKVNPQLLEEARTKANVEFIVFLHENADVSKAKLLKNKADKGRYVHQQLLATAQRTQSNMIEVFESFDAPYTTYIIVNAAWGVGNIQLMEALSRLPEVRSIQYNAKFKIPDLAENDLTTDGVEFRGIEWGVENINAPAVWQKGFTGQGTVVGGADTGYKWDHATLKKKYRGWDNQNNTADHDYNWHDAIHLIDNPTNPCPPDSATPCDGHDHGTHTMGTMVGDDEAGNQIGVAPGATWIGCKNMVTLGVGYLQTYMECMEWFLAPYPVGGSTSEGLAEKAPDVINNSWACVEGCTDLVTGDFIPVILESMETTINNLRDGGTVFVGSAGNDGSQCNTIAFPPAFFEGTFTVGATDINNNIAGFSSRGDVVVDGGASFRLKPNVAAPGVNVRSAVKNGGYSNFSGTSMAGPHVAGAVALVISANPNLKGDVEAIENVFEGSARGTTTSQGCGGDSDTDIPNNVYGYGIIDVLEAVNMVEVLPVELLDFYGNLENNKVLLHWSTASEKENDFFEIQRSNDLENWKTIGKVAGKNNTTDKINYNFTDQTPLLGTSYYRLRQVDRSGKSTLSKAIVIEVKDLQHTVATLYPNPSNGQVNIRLNNEALVAHQQLTITIFNSLGQLKQQQSIKNDSELMDLPVGIHFYIITDANKNVLQEGKLIVE